jgi:hypothetical protein
MGPYGDVAQNPGSASDESAFRDGGVALRSALVARRPERHSLVYGDVVPDDGGLADHYTHTVVYEHALSYSGAGVDLYPCPPPYDLTKKPGQHRDLKAGVKKIKQPVSQNGMKTRVAKDYFQNSTDTTGKGGIVFYDGPVISLDGFEYFHGFSLLFPMFFRVLQCFDFKTTATIAFHGGNTSFDKKTGLPLGKPVYQVLAFGIYSGIMACTGFAPAA